MNKIKAEILSLEKKLKASHYGTMLRVGPSADARAIFRREPYHLTAVKREKETILNDYRERSQKNSR